MKTALCANTVVVVCLGFLLLAACSRQPTIFANPDPELRKSVGEWRADAATRFPYKEDAPSAREAKARAEVEYGLNRLELVNFSGQDWTDVDVWVNQQYVCHVPKLQDRKLKEIHFPMLFNRDGKSFPMNNRLVRVEKLELFRDGMMYEIVCDVGDY